MRTSRIIAISASAATLIAASPASALYPVPFKPGRITSQTAKDCGFELHASTANFPKPTKVPVVTPKLSKNPVASRLPTIKISEHVAPSLRGLPKNASVVIQLDVPCKSKWRTIVIGTATTSASGTLQLPAIRMKKPTSFNIPVVFPDRRVAKLAGLAQ